jgi:hypothetical protein
MGMPTSDLQYLFYLQMQQNNEKKINLKFQNCDILFEMFWKKLKTFLVWNPISFSL